MPARNSTTPRPLLCYGSVILMFVVVPVAAYIDVGHVPSVVEIVLHTLVVLVVCLVPLAYFASHRWTFHSVVSAVAGLCLLCFGLLAIKAGVSRAVRVQDRGGASS